MATPALFYQGVEAVVSSKQRLGKAPDRRQVAKVEIHDVGRAALAGHSSGRGGVEGT